jgi:hypothetical protein
VTGLGKAPAKKSLLEFKAIGRAIAKKAAELRVATSSKLARIRTKKIVIEQIIAENGIPRHQQVDILREIVDPENTACGGASCQRVLGFGPDDVEEILDDTLGDVKNSPTLSKPEHAAKKEILLASLTPTENPSPRRDWGFSPRAIAFRLAKATGYREVQIGTSGLNVSIDIAPRDLMRAERVSCHRGLCEASLTIPLKVHADAELPLNTKIQLTYVEAPNARGDYVEQKVAIDGKVRTLRLGEILDVNVDFVAKAEKTVESGKKMVVKEVRCEGSVVCDLPMISFSAKVNREGIELAGSTKPTSISRSMMKVSREGKSFKREFKFSDLPPYIQTIKRILGIYPADPLDPRLDLRWDELVFAVTQ